MLFTITIIRRVLLHNIMTNKEPNDTQKKGGLSCAVLLTLLSAIVIVFIVPSLIYFYSAWKESKQLRIIHFLIDDYSKSARVSSEEDFNLAQEHCKASSNMYLKGDTQVRIAFANRPEVVSNKVLGNNLAPGLPLVSCKKEYTPSYKVGDDFGTSLTDVMQYVQTLISNERAKNSQKPIIVTITIQHAELDLEGKERAKKFEYLRRIVSQITSDNKVFIEIIGPIGALQKGLEEYLGDLKGISICSKNDVKSCVEGAFSIARTN